MGKDIFSKPVVRGGRTFIAAQTRSGMGKRAGEQLF